MVPNGELIQSCLVHLFLLSMEPWAAAKKLSVSVAVPPAPVQVPSQRPLAPSVASVTSVANDKADNEMVLGAVLTKTLLAWHNPRISYI